MRDYSGLYKCGDIVRYGDTWGVVRRVGRWLDPLVDWWVGQYAANQVEQWVRREWPLAGEGAPFAHDYSGIPPQVIARSMQIILTEGTMP